MAIRHECPSCHTTVPIRYLLGLKNEWACSSCGVKLVLRERGKRNLAVFASFIVLGVLIVPLLYVLGPFGFGLCLLWPVLLFLAMRMSDKLIAHGVYCSKCGYDLTGNTSGVCPECGAKIDG